MSQLVTINLSKQPGASWGFRLQGGKDFAQPLGIQKVNVGSVAEQAGVRVGDSIVSIGGTDALSLRHKEAQDAIVKAGNSFQLVVQRGSSLWKPKVTPLPQPTKTPQGPVATQTSLAKSQATKPQRAPKGFNATPTAFGEVNGTPIVNPQYNSPINLYNEDSIAEALSAQSEVLGKGCLGVNFMKNDPRTGAADKESDVLKMVQEMDRAPKTPPVSSGTNSVYCGAAPPSEMMGTPEVPVQGASFRILERYLSGEELGSRPGSGVSSPVPGAGPTRSVQAPVTKPRPQGEEAQGGATVCGQCDRPIIGVFVRIKNKNLHADCFRCNTCGSSLKNVGYYNVSDKLYCDVHAKQAAKHNPPGPNLVPVTVKPGAAPPPGAVAAPKAPAPAPAPALNQTTALLTEAYDKLALQDQNLLEDQDDQSHLYTADQYQQQQQHYAEEFVEQQQVHHAHSEQQSFQQEEFHQELFQQENDSGFQDVSTGVSAGDISEKPAPVEAPAPPAPEEVVPAPASAPPQQQLPAAELATSLSPAPAPTPSQSSVAPGGSSANPAAFGAPSGGVNVRSHIPKKGTAPAPSFTAPKPAAASTFAPAPKPAAPAPAPSFIAPKPAAAPAQSFSAPAPSFSAPKPAAPAPAPMFGGGGVGMPKPAPPPGLGGIAKPPGPGGPPTKGIPGERTAPKRGRGVMNPAVASRIPICASCQRQIRGPFVTALGKNWCPDHFHCATDSCRKPLIDVGFVEEQGSLYCEDCYEKYLAPTCGKCDKRIKGDCLNAVGKQFHPECFCCTYCGKVFGSGAFYLEDGLPYCETDWNDLFTTKCVGCGFPIEAGDRWVEALNNNYHSQCFKCSVCKSNLEGKSFYAKNGRPFCKSHAGR